MEFFDQYPLLLAPVIFLARIGDVSVGTLRMILVVRGHRMWSAALGFFEVLIWIAAAGLVFNNLSQWYLALAYAGGFAAGNVVGIWLEGKLAIGLEMVRVISRNPGVELAQRLGRRGYSVIELVGEAEDDAPVEVLLIVETRRKVPGLLQAITEEDATAFWTISDIKRQEAVLPALAPNMGPTYKRK